MNLKKQFMEGVAIKDRNIALTLKKTPQIFLRGLVYALLVHCSC